VASVMPQLPRGEGRRSEQIMGEAPLAAKARAMARPRPEEEPVTIVTRESRRVESKGMVMMGVKSVRVAGYRRPCAWN